MLFFLTNTLIVDKTDPSFQKIKRAVRNLAVAATEGKHMVLGDIESVAYFSDIFFNNDDDVSRFFNRLNQNFAFATIPSEITMYVEVVNGIEQEIISDRCEIKQLDYSHFLDTACIQATTLLCEDVEYDCQLYKFIMKWFVKNIQRNINTNLNDSHGGGDRIGNILKDCVKKGLVCLCIVDSDMSFPGQTMSSHSTAHECMGIKRGKLEELLVLNVHEAENLLPINYIDMVPNNLLPIQKKNSFRKLYEDELAAESILRYFDLKNGLLKLENYFDCADFIKYARTVCEANPEFLNGESFDDYYNEKKIKETLYPGVAKRILSFTLDVMRIEDLPAPQLMRYQFDEWVRVGQAMLNYCCAERVEKLLN